MKLTCPNCGREHPLREPFPAPGSRIVCACGRRLSVQYPPNTLEQLKKRGARFQTEAESALGQGKGGHPGMDEEATSLFTAQQIEEASRAARTAGGTLVPEVGPSVRPPPVRALPPARPDARQIPVPAPPPVAAPPRTKPVFEEEPTSLFMSDGETREANLRAIPDHGRTGLIVPADVLKELGGDAAARLPRPSAPSVPSPSATPPPAGGARPVVIEAPAPPRQSFSSGPDLTTASFDPAPNLAASSMEPVASSAALPADQAFPESASGVRRGATLDEIMRLKVQDRSAQKGALDRVPKVALALLVLLGVGASLFIVVAIVVVATR